MDREGPAAKATTDHFWATKSPAAAPLPILLDGLGHPDPVTLPRQHMGHLLEHRLFQVQGLVLSP